MQKIQNAVEKITNPPLNSVTLLQPLGGNHIGETVNSNYV